MIRLLGKRLDVLGGGGLWRGAVLEKVRARGQAREHGRIGTLHVHRHLPCVSGAGCGRRCIACWVLVSRSMMLMRCRLDSNSNTCSCDQRESSDAARAAPTMSNARTSPRTSMVISVSVRVLSTMPDCKGRMSGGWYRCCTHLLGGNSEGLLVRAEARVLRDSATRLDTQAVTHRQCNEKVVNSPARVLIGVQSANRFKRLAGRTRAWLEHGQHTIRRVEAHQPPVNRAAATNEAVEFSMLASLLKTIEFCVSVPVLSAKMCSIWPSSSMRSASCHTGRPSSIC